MRLPPPGWSRTGRAVPALIAIAALGVASKPADALPGAACAVTIPTRVAGGGFGPGAFNYGNARLRVGIGWPHGTLPAGTLPDGGSYATIEDDGSIRAKVGWWRGLARKLVVTGRRLDAPAPPLRAQVSSSGYGPKGFVPSILRFPTVGCWRVQGTLGPARLTFVVRVKKL